MKAVSEADENANANGTDGKGEVEPQQEKLGIAVIGPALILAFGALAPLLDSTMVNIALKTLTGDLKSTVDVIQWVITGYMLTMGLAVPVSAWSVKRFGGKKVYIFSLAIFLVGSALSSCAWSADSLIAFRLLQGVGAGLLMPTLQTILVELAGGKHLGQIISVISIPTLLAPILGPVIGGIIINGLSWRWIFYVNIPVTAIALLLSWKGLPNDKPASQKPHLDILGLLMLSPAFAILIYGIAQISSHGSFDNSAVIVPLAIGVALLVAYVIYALFLQKEPALDLHLFRSRNFSASSLMLFISGMVTNGGVFLLPLYFQQVRGDSVLIAGLLMIPQAVGMLTTRTWIGKMSDHTGARPIVLVCLAGTIIGTLPFAYAGAQSNLILLGAAMIVRGASLNGLLIPIMVSTYVGLRKDQVGHASAATRIFQTLGGAFGTAILATVAQHQLTSQLASGIQGISALTNAFNVAFWWAIGFAVVAFIPTFLLAGRKPESKPAAQEAAA